VGRRDQLPGDALIGVHVLVVDDDADARELITTVLEYCGALVTGVSSASAALETLSRITPDVVLADLSLPHRDGYWLIQQLHALGDHDGGTVAAIAVSGHASPHPPDRALAAGYQGHLRKPIDPWEMCRLVATLVGRR
jgi:CheY-like chemotaxis protein